MEIIIYNKATTKPFSVSSVVNQLWGTFAKPSEVVEQPTCGVRDHFRRSQWGRVIVVGESLAR